MWKEPYDTLINGGSGTQEVISSMSGSQTVIGNSSNARMREPLSDL